MPGVRIPSFPFGGAMLVGRRIRYPPICEFPHQAPGGATGEFGSERTLLSPPSSLRSYRATRNSSR